MKTVKDQRQAIRQSIAPRLGARASGPSPRPLWTWEARLLDVGASSGASALLEPSSLLVVTAYLARLDAAHHPAPQPAPAPERGRPIRPHASSIPTFHDGDGPEARA